MQAQRRTACVANPGCRRDDRRLRRCKWQPALRVDWTVCRLPELYNHTLDTALFDVENPAFFTNVVSAVCWCSLACQGVFLPVCDAVCGVRALAGRQARECDSAKPDACAAAQGVRVSAIESPLKFCSRPLFRWNPWIPLYLPVFCRPFKHLLTGELDSGTPCRADAQAFSAPLALHEPRSATQAPPYRTHPPGRECVAV